MIKKETIIGFVGLVLLMSVLIGVNALRSKHYLSRDIVLYAKFKSVTGLMRTQPVRISGRMVGEVTRIFKESPTSEWIVVEMRLVKGTQVPKYAVPYVLDGSGVGISASELHISFSGVCEDDCAVSYDTLMGREKLYTDIISAETLASFDPILAKLSNMDSVSAMIDGMRISMNNAGKLLTKVSPELRSMFVSASGTTGSLFSKNATISNLLDSLATMTGRISHKNFGKTIADVQASIVQINTKLVGLDPTFAKADAAVDKISKALDTLMQNPALKKLLEDPEMAIKLRPIISKMDSMVTDIRIHPKKYLRLGKSRKIIEVD